MSLDSDCAGSQHQAGLAGYFIPMALALGSTKHEVVGVELTLLQESVFQVKHPASMAYKRITAGCLGYSVYLGSAVGDWWLNLRFGLSALVAAQVCTPSRAVAIKWRLRVEPPGAERISVRATGLDSCPTSLAPSQKYARSLMPPPPPPRQVHVCATPTLSSQVMFWSSRSQHPSRASSFEESLVGRGQGLKTWCIPCDQRSNRISQP